MKMTIEEIRAFDNYAIKELSYGRVVVKTRVSDQSLNRHGHAHGGFLFTLADEISGMTVRTTGHKSVTMQASINYLRPGLAGSHLTITGQITHDGKTSKVIDTSITNTDGKLVAKGTFTMAVIGQAED